MLLQVRSLVAWDKDGLSLVPRCKKEHPRSTAWWDKPDIVPKRGGIIRPPLYGSDPDIVPTRHGIIRPPLSSSQSQRDLVIAQ